MVRLTSVYRMIEIPSSKEVLGFCALRAAPRRQTCNPSFTKLFLPLHRGGFDRVIRSENIDDVAEQRRRTQPHAVRFGPSKRNLHAGGIDILAGAEAMCQESVFFKLQPKISKSVEKSLL